MAVGVRIAGSSINMDGSADGDGDRFVVEDIEGLDSAETDIVIAETNQDGSLLSSARFSKREMLIKGWASSATSLGAFRLRNKISAAFNDYFWAERQLFFDIPSPGVAWVINARLGGKIHFDKPRGNAQAFEIPMTADDPRLYSQTETTVTVNGTAGTVLTNVGNYPVFITATLSTGATNPYIESQTAGNARITLSGSIASGTEINFRNREVTVPGQGVRELANRPRIWFPLYPGANTLKSNAPFSVKFRSGWA